MKLANLPTCAVQGCECVATRGATYPAVCVGHAGTGSGAVSRAPGVSQDLEWRALNVDAIRAFHREFDMRLAS